MSRPTPTATDLIEEASLPCHHRREPFGPCETCLEDVVHAATSGLRDEHADEILSIGVNHQSEIEQRNADKANLEDALEDARNATRKLIRDVRKVSEWVTKSTKKQIEQQLDAVADKAETAI